MFIKLYHTMDRWWQKTEIFLTVVVLTLMTFITFLYSVVNNLYMPFYHAADWIAKDEPSKLEDILLNMGDFMMDFATSLVWSNEFTAVCFAWLIFFCMSYGVRIGGHIGVDALIKLFNTKVQRLFAYIGLGACLLYSTILLYASISWVYHFFLQGTLTEGLDRFGVAQWHITIIMPIGFFLLIWRYLEVGYRIFTYRQDGLGLADEAADAIEELNLSDKE